MSSTPVDGGPVDPAAVADVRAAFDRVGYTVEGVADLLGGVAFRALAREEPVPAERVTREALRDSGRDASRRGLAALVRLFLLARPVPLDVAREALPWESAVRLGLVRADREADGDQARAVLDVRPYAADDDCWYVVSDLAVGATGRPAGREHVLGVGGASTTLARATVRPDVVSALDLGTGCGVQALHLTQHASHVTATDTNPRALDLARLTLALSGAQAELLGGDLFAPVEGRRFDLVVSNPPFVISPAGRFTYRDAGLAGDALGRALVRAAPHHLTDGGWCQLLANWEHHVREDWTDRVAAWVEGTGCDAWVVQRDVQDPAEYAELWLRDSGDVSGPDRDALYEAWLADFETRGVEGVGFGIVTLRRTGAVQPVVSVRDLRHEVQWPIGDEIVDWFARQDFLRAHDGDRLLGARLVAVPGLVQEQHGPPGDEPERLLLRQTDGLRCAAQVDALEAGLAGASDGRLAVGAICDAMAELTGVSAAVVREQLLPGVRRLVADGFLRPVS